MEPRHSSGTQRCHGLWALVPMRHLVPWGTESGGQLKCKGPQAEGKEKKEAGTVGDRGGAASSLGRHEASQRRWHPSRAPKDALGVTQMEEDRASPTQGTIYAKGTKNRCRELCGLRMGITECWGEGREQCSCQIIGARYEGPRRPRYVNMWGFNFYRSPA